jgi:hypothetical protein
VKHFTFSCNWSIKCPSVDTTTIRVARLRVHYSFTLFHSLSAQVYARKPVFDEALASTKPPVSCSCHIQVAV